MTALEKIALEKLSKELWEVNDKILIMEAADTLEAMKQKLSFIKRGVGDALLTLRALEENNKK